MTITVKKSNIAMLKGLKKTNAEIGECFGITEKEVQETLVSFGLVKAKGRKVPEKAYSIELVDDMEKTGKVKEDSIKQEEVL